MSKRVLSHPVHELGTSDKKLLWLESNVLNERLENLEIDVSSHRESLLKHFEFGASRTRRKCIKLDKQAWEHTHLEDSLLHHVVNAVELLKIVIILIQILRPCRVRAHYTTWTWTALQYRVENLCLPIELILAEEQSKE